MRGTLTEMKDRPELDALLRESVRQFNALSPAEVETMLREQQKSWARQDMD